MQTVPITDPIQHTREILREAVAILVKDQEMPRQKILYAETGAGRSQRSGSLRAGDLGICESSRNS